MFEVGNLVETTPDGTSLFNPTNRKAVVTDTTALGLYGFIGVVWLGGNPDARDGLFMANFFQRAEQDIYADTPSGGAGMTITRPPYAIGDVVEFKKKDYLGNTVLAIVVMTDWHRDGVYSANFGTREYVKIMRELMFDGNPDNEDAINQKYLDHPCWLYVIPITHPGEYEYVGPVLAAHVTLYCSASELRVKILKE